LGGLAPLLVDDEALLELADAGEIFIERALIVSTERGAERAGLVADAIQNAPAVFEAPQLGLDFVLFPFEEHLGEEPRWRVVGRHAGAGPRPRQPEPLTREGQAGEAGLAADLLGCELIDRDRVADAWLAGAGDAG